MSAEAVHQRPLVSILMAARDCAESVEEALDSILCQDYMPFEFLVTDDGSVDATAQVLRTRAAREPRMRLFRSSTPRGLTRSLNEMLPEARGEFIARMDADDISLPGRLAAQVARLQRDPEIGLLGTWVREIDAAGRALHELRYPDSHAWMCTQLSAGRNPLTHGSLMMRRDLLLSLPPPVWRFTYGQDNDLNLRLMDRTRFAILPEVLYVRRLHAGGMCSAGTYLRPRIKTLALQLHADRRSGRPERDWSTLEREIVESSQQEEQADLMESYSVARGELLAGRLPAARRLWREARRHPQLRYKANVMLFVAAMPMATRLLKSLLKLYAYRDPMREYVQQIDTSS